MIHGKNPHLPSRPRGRPVISEEKIEETRQRIADHAIHLFQAHGYDAVSMRRLAQSAGCTVKTLYRYYDRKIDILREVWARVFEELFDELDAVAAKHGDPLVKLEAVAAGYVQFWIENRDSYFLVFMSSNVEQADVSIFVGDDDNLVRFSIFREIIDQCAPGELSGAELKLRSELLLCTLNGIAHNLITISAYPWSRAQDLAHEASRRLV